MASQNGAVKTHPSTMDEELLSTLPSSGNPDLLHFRTESSEEPSPMPFNHFEHPYEGFYPGFVISTPECIRSEHITNGPPSAFPLDCTYNFPTTSSQRQPMDLWNSCTCAQDKPLWSPTDPEWQMNHPRLPRPRSTEYSHEADARSTHVLDPCQFHSSEGHLKNSNESAERIGSNPSMSIHHSEQFGMALPGNGHITDGEHSAHQEVARTTPGEERDFGEILSRAMKRASGRLIALLQEELDRLSSENELTEDIDKTDEALSDLNLEKKKSRCRL